MHADSQRDLRADARGDLAGALFPDIAGDRTVGITRSAAVKRHRLAAAVIAVGNVLVAAGVGHRRLVRRRLAAAGDVDQQLAAVNPCCTGGKFGTVVAEAGLVLGGLKAGPHLRRHAAAVRVAGQSRFVVHGKLATLGQAQGTVVAYRAPHVALGTLIVPRAVGQRRLAVQSPHQRVEHLGPNRVDSPDFARDGVARNVLVLNRPVPRGPVFVGRRDDHLDRRQQVARHNAGRTVDVRAVIEVGCLAGLGVGNGER